MRHWSVFFERAGALRLVICMEYQFREQRCNKDGVDIPWVTRGRYCLRMLVRRSFREPEDVIISATSSTVSSGA